MIKENIKKILGHWKNPFIWGCSITFALCSAFGGMYVKLNSITIENYEIRIEHFKEEITRLRSYEATYHEGIRSKEKLYSLQSLYSELEAKYTALVNENWPQKYEVERIKNVSMTEKMTLEAARQQDKISRLSDERNDLREQNLEFEKRIASIPLIRNHEVGEGLKAFDDLLAQKNKLEENNIRLIREIELKDEYITELRNKLRISEGEILKLREVIQKTAISKNRIDDRNVVNKSEIDIICAALENISDDSTAGKILYQQLSGIGKKILGQDFVRVLKVANISTDSIEAQVIIRCASYLEYPISAGTLRTIVQNISDDETQAEVIRVLTKAQAAYNKK